MRILKKGRILHVRAKFIFEVSKNQSEVHNLPVYYRTIFISFLKRALSLYDKDYFDRI